MSHVAVKEPVTRPSFAEVAATELDSVHRYLLHLTRDPHLADDLTSATFERAMRDWRRFDPRKGRPGVWLIEIARRQALDHFRSEGRRRRRDERYASEEPRESPAPEVGGLSPDLRVALGGLSRSERELIALRVVLGFDGAEAAEVSGMSTSAVSTGLHRALSKLRTHLGEEDAP